MEEALLSSLVKVRTAQHVETDVKCLLVALKECRENPVTCMWLEQPRHNTRISVRDEGCFSGWNQLTRLLQNIPFFQNVVEQ